MWYATLDANITEQLTSDKVETYTLIRSGTVVSRGTHSCAIISGYRAFDLYRPTELPMRRPPVVKEE